MKTSPKNSVQIVIVLAVLSLLTLGSLAHCATITWINTSGGNWSVASNWNPNQVPTNTDTALITTPGTYTVTFDFNANPNSFYPAVTLGAGGGAAGVQTLAMTSVTFGFTNLMVTKGGVLTANGAHLGQNTGPSMTVTNGGLVNCTNSGFYAAVLVANGGSIIGLGNDSFNSSLTVAGGGVLNDVTVTIPYGATATVASGGTMNLTAPSGTYGVLNGSLVNSGTFNCTNGGFNLAYQMLGLWAGGILNQPGGQLNLNGSVSFFANGYVSGGITTIDTTYFTNKGTLTQTTGSGTSDVSVAAVDNSQGTITNLSGVLSLATMRTNLAGVFFAAPGAAIQLYAINDGATVTVPGSPLVISGGGSVQFCERYFVLCFKYGSQPGFAVRPFDFRSGLPRRQRHESHAGWNRADKLRDRDWPAQRDQRLCHRKHLRRGRRRVLRHQRLESGGHFGGQRRIGDGWWLQPARTGEHFSRRRFDSQWHLRIGGRADKFRIGRAQQRHNCSD